MNAIHPMIPDQVKGKENNIETSKVFDTQYESVAAYQRAYERMHDPLHWHVLTRVVVARFLMPENRSLNKTPLISTGNFFRIEIPGPGPANGDGYDWVKVDNVIEDNDPGNCSSFFGMTFRACSNPERNTKATAHFFQSLATSTFIIQRHYLSVSASYHGRNEIPNTHTNSTMGNIRNAFVSLGAAAGLSDTVWSILVKSLLEE